MTVPFRPPWRPAEPVQGTATVPAPLDTGIPADPMEAYVRGVNDALQARRELFDEGDCSCEDCIRDAVGVHIVEDPYA